MEKRNTTRALALMLALLCTFSLPSCVARKVEFIDIDISELTNAPNPEYDRFVVLPSGIELALSDDGSYYILQNGKNCNMELLNVPETYNGKPIAEIADNAFYGNTSIKKLILPESIIRIGYGVFSGCDNLEYNEYGNAKYLGNEKNPYAFLISSVSQDINFVEINSAVRIIYASAFRNHENLTSLAFPDSLKSIGKQAFSCCSNLKEVDFGEGVEYIGEQAFDFTGLVSISLPDSVICVDNSAFSSNLSLKELDLGNSVEIIGINAFVGLNVEVLELPDSVTEIGNGAFAGSKIKKLVIGDGLKRIEPRTFSDCSALKEINFGNSVEYIASDAFKECKALRDVKLPKSLKTIDPTAFWKCDNSIYNDYNGVWYLGNGESDYACLMLLPLNYDGNLVLHPDVRVIARAGENVGLNAVNLTNTVKMDGEGKYLKVVDNCVIDPATKTLILGANESRIPNDGSVTSIGDYAFSQRNNLNDVILPDGLISIGDYAFSGCDGIGTVKFNAELESIGDFAFAHSDHLKKAILPESVKYIGESAFTGCQRISEIYIPGSVEEIGIQAFSHCYNAYKITIGEGVTRLSGAIFDDCNKVTEVVLPSTIKIIDKGAFRQLYSLFKIELPEGLLYIEDYAFQHCSKLLEINMPKSLLGVGMKAFEGCRGLGKVNFNSGILEIGDNALNGISDYAKVTFAGTVGMWKNIDNSDNLILGKEDLKVICLDGEVLLKPDPAPWEPDYD